MPRRLTFARQRRLTRAHKILLGLAALAVLAVAVYFIPPVHSRLAWRLEDLRTRIKYFFNPPANVTFVPVQSPAVDWMVTQTLRALWTPTPSATPRPPDLPTFTPTLTPTPLPGSVSLKVPIYANQCNRWNYCGLANLSMALGYWNWKGTPGDTRDLRDQIATVVKPGESDPGKSFIDRGKTDKNVMPYELVDFVNDHTDLRARYYYGGNINLLKRMIAGGFPVIIEKGYYQRDYSGRTAWMGHYAFVTGYDEDQEQFTWQDSYPNRCQDADPKTIEKKGRDNRSDYSDLIAGWRGFDYVFIVVYPADREVEVLSLLGTWADYGSAAQEALKTADVETSTLEGTELFFAWFNKGTSYVALTQYTEAAAAYDRAFALYGALGNNDSERPYRILWYETGPYWAYYNTGRYQDVINLANTTLKYLTDRPSFEESLYWRARAEYALGDFTNAYQDIRQAVYYNANFQAALDMMVLWGVTP